MKLSKSPDRSFVSDTLGQNRDPSVRLLGCYWIIPRRFRGDIDHMCKRLSWQSFARPLKRGGFSGLTWL